MNSARRGQNDYGSDRYRNIGWKVVGVSYMDEVMTSKKEVNNYMLKVLLFSLLLVLLISALMSARYFQADRQLEKAMKSVERGDFNTMTCRDQRGAGD